MLSIKEILDKIKTGGEAILDNPTAFSVILIILVACSSFGLGRLSKITSEKATISLSNFIPENNLANLSTTSNQTSSTDLKIGKYVASKNGNKYHAPWCTGAQRIKDENKIWFNSKAEAEVAGYTPAGNCKGL